MSKLSFINKITTIIIFLCFLMLANISVSYAQEESDPTQSASLEGIKKIIEENLNSGVVRGTIDNLLNRKTAILGEVSRVTEETITITNRQGTRIIPINDTLSITKDSKTITASEIAVENWVTVLGKIAEDNFSPTFLWVYSQSPMPQNQYVSIGTITDITGTTITIVPRSDENSATINVLNSTEYEDVDGVEISLSDLSEDITILVSGYENESKIEAKTIRSLAPISDE